VDETPMIADFDDRPPNRPFVGVVFGSVAWRPLRFGKLDRIFQVPSALVEKTSRQLAMAVRLAALRNLLGLYCSVGIGSRWTGSLE
jgi:hypothetical protein